MPDYAAPQDKEKLISWLEKKRKDGRSRMPDLQMKLNMAYLLGHQWIVWDRSRSRFERVQHSMSDPNSPIRITVNKIAPVVEQFIARITKTAPVPECRPVSDEDDDIDAAKVGDRILNHEMTRMDWHARLVQLYFWVVPLGWSFLHVAWDPNEGEFIGEDDDGDVHQGEVTLEIVPAFQLSVDPNALCMDEALWAVRTITMTKEAVWERWGKEVNGDPARSLVDDVYALADSASDNPRRSMVDQVEVHQLWMRPCRAAKKGMVVTWSGQTILEDPKDFPYEHEHLPFVEFDLLPGLGTREGRTWVTDLLPIQADYNDARSREAHLRRVLTPKILAPVGSIDPNRISSRVEVWTYNPTGHEPKFEVPPNSWMQQYEQGMERTASEISERAGQNDRSTAPSGASLSAASVQAIQEQDDTKLSISVKLMSKAISEVGYQILELVRQFWTEERLVRTWSQEGELQVAHFSGADLSHQLDVHLTTESALPRSKAARRELMDLMWDKQIINDPQVYVRALDVPGVDFITEQMSTDKKQAQRENQQLAVGQHVEVHGWDNHAVHIKEHNDFRKGQDYEKMPPELKAVIDGHVSAHDELVLGQMNQPTPTGTPHMPGAGMGPLAPGTPTPDKFMSPQGSLPNMPTTPTAPQAPPEAPPGA